MSIVAFPEKENQGKGCQEEGFPPPIFSRAGGGVVMPNVSKMGMYILSMCPQVALGLVLKPIAEASTLVK